MAVKQMKFESDARAEIAQGLTQLARAVKATLGPRGRNVVLDKKFGSPASTKDGVTVAKEIQLDDPFENMGAQMVREVASKTSDVAGDGTTTATVLAQAIFREGLKQVTGGHGPMEIKRGIEQAVDVVVEELRKLSREVKGKTEIAQVGTISANNDASIGDMIAEAMEKVGREGVITVEEGKSLANELEVVEGTQFDRGYLSPYFITDADKQKVVLEDASILLYDRKISTVRELLPLLEHVARAAKPLLVIAEEIEGGSIKPSGATGGDSFSREFSRKVGAKGWLGMTWPKKYGGHERTFLERYVVTEELRVANAPTRLHFVADRQSGPILLKYAPEHIKMKVLPAICRGECCFVLAGIRALSLRDRVHRRLLSGRCPLRFN